MRTARVAAAVLVPLGLLAAPLRAQAVHVVDEWAGSAELQDVLDLAASGDTILLRSVFGFSEGVVDGKSLVIVADAPSPGFPLTFVVRNLAADQSVLLRSLELEGLAFVESVPAVTCEQNAGVVWIEDCALTGSTSDFWIGELPPGGPALAVSGSAAVVVLRSVLQGGRGSTYVGSQGHANDMSPGGPGLLADDSHVVLAECLVNGGRGGSGEANEDVRGADAIQATGSSLVLDRVTATGGDGGATCSSAFAELCGGGDGLQLDGACVVQALDSSFTAGVGSALSDGGSAPSGVDSLVLPGDVWADWPGPGRTLSVDSPVRESETVTIRFEGLPGDTFALFIALQPRFLPLPGKQGVFALASPLGGPSLHVMPAPDGTLDVPFTAWPVSALGLEVLTTYGQCFVIAPGGAVTLSDPTALIVLSSAY